jgi:hypothetical protein
LFAALESTMRNVLLVVCLGVLLSAWGAGSSVSGESKAVPQYNAEHELLRPEGYRTWVFVGTTIGLKYARPGEGIKPRESDNYAHPAVGDFHNVYIDPKAYEEYARTGKFPDGTMLVMDVYKANQREPQNIVTGGLFPGEQKEIELAVKDSKRPDGSKTDWAYYAFPRGQASAKPFPDAACYDCHKKHASDDNVWVQFYPTLRALQKIKP